MSTAPPPEPKPSGALTPVQRRLLWVPPAVVAALFCHLCARRPEYASLLWTDLLGIKMLAGAVALLVVVGALFFAGCRLLNRSPRMSRTTAVVLQTVLAAVWLCGFCLPAGFVLRVGPVAVQIQQNVARD